MKKTLLISMLASMLLSFTAVAQKAFEGKVVFAISYENLPEGMEQFAAMMPSEMVMHIKNHLSRNEQTMGMGSSQVTITDAKKKTSVFLMDMMGQKLMTKMGKEYFKEINDKKPEVKQLDETKVIAGYTCQKAEITPEGTGSPITIYYTKDLPNRMDSQFSGINGFPLEYEISNMEMLITYSATEVLKMKVPDELFDIPDGYSEVDQESLGKILEGGL